MSCATFRLTPDFALGEFAVSRSHPDLVEQVPDHLGPRVVRLATEVLQPTRVYHGRPLTVISGYRSAALNTAVGGSDTSQHTLAEAADYTTESLYPLFKALMSRRVEIVCGQVIYYPDQVFIHAALPSQRFPNPTFCLHQPARGFKYRVLRDVAELEELLR